METVNELLRRGAPAREVLRAADAESQLALGLAAEVGDDLGRFWEECPSPYLLLRVAQRAEVPLWLQAQAVSRALDEAVSRVLPPSVVERMRRDLFGVAEGLRASPGPDFQGGMRCGARWLTVSHDRAVAQAVQAAAWITRASALLSCTCGADHGPEARFALGEAVDYTLSLLRGWADSVVDPADKPTSPEQREAYMAALGRLACDEMRQVLDLQTVAAAREWAPVRSAGGVS